MRTCVLIVGRQPVLCAAIARIVCPLECRVEIVATEKRARQLIKQERFEAAIVATSLLAAPDLAFLREVHNSISKLVLLVDDANCVRRLAAVFSGAYVCPSQSLDPEKLLAFLRSKTSSSAVNDAAVTYELLHFAGCTVDIPGRLFLNAERREVLLTNSEFSLLVAFARNHRRVLSRAQLRNAIDGRKSDDYDRSIDMLVARLRRKIEPEPNQARFIATVAGAGYKFLPGVCTVDSASASPDTSQSAAAETQPVERRQLTILSCEILGFAALAAQSDPENLEEGLNRVYQRCADVIARFGGTIECSVGESVVAYFGYPTAQENDAENAVRAALTLLPVVAGVEAAATGKFRARMGIATGLMVVGARSGRAGKESTIVGEALNLAIHMQHAAPAGSVVIGQRTRELIGRLFECRELDPVTLEDGYQPVPVWRVTGEIAGMSRFDALRREGMPDLVGRSAETERLVQYWASARRGAGQVMLLSGEPGIGKSRLAIELQRTLRHEPHIVLRCSGSPHRSEAPMAALLDAVQRVAGFAAADPAEQKLHKLNAAFAVLGVAAAEATALIAGLLGLPCEIPSQIKELFPQKRKERVFAALLESIEQIAASTPVLAMVEDAHWLDPTSLEFLTLLVERAGTLCLLLLTVARPDFTPPWSDYSYVSTLTLSRLSGSDSALLIHAVAGERPVAAALEDAIVSRADGVPLFVEELTKSMLERRVPRAGARIPADPREPAGGDDKDVNGAPVQNAPIPTTLQGLLLARFDQLDSGKEVAQAGAVIGREFSFELLRLVAGLDEPTLRGALDQLVASGLVFRRGALPHATFVFKHALVRDAAYSTLLRQRRQQLHTSVARSYEEHFPETVETQPELLAYHFGEAVNPIKTIGYLLVAAERAVLRSSAHQALAHLARARKLIYTLPESRERCQLALRLEIVLGRALIAQRSYTAPATRGAYQRARTLCEVLGDQASLPLIIHAQWVSAWSAADLRSALKEAQELYAWGKRNSQPAGMAAAHVDFGMTLTTLGGLIQGRRHLDQALQINQFVLPGRQPFMFSDTEPGRISALRYLHYCLLLLGFPDQAKAAAQEAAGLAPHQLYTRALEQTYVLRMHVLERDVGKAAETGAAVLRLSQELGYPYFIGTSMIHTGWAMAQCGDTAGGIEYCQNGLTQLRTIGVKCWLPFYLALLAECYEQVGDTERAVETVAQALEISESTGEHFWQPEIYRLQGKLHLRCNNKAAAEEFFVTALGKARQKKIKLLELRAATSLADLLMRERRPMEALQVLAPVYSSFTEGFDFVDLREANVFLQSLQADSKISSRARRAQASRLPNCNKI